MYFLKFIKLENRFFEKCYNAKQPNNILVSQLKSCDGLRFKCNIVDKIYLMLLFFSFILFLVSCSRVTIQSEPERKGEIADSGAYLEVNSISNESADNEKFEQEHKEIMSEEKWGSEKIVEESSWIECSGTCPQNKEVCNGLDDNDNGSIDENAICPSGQQCYKGQCQLICKQGECPNPYSCKLISEDIKLCLLPCDNQNRCPDGYICRNQFCLLGCSPECASGYDCIQNQCVLNKEKETLEKIKKLSCQELIISWNTYSKQHNECNTTQDCSVISINCGCLGHYSGTTINKNQEKIAYAYIERLLSNECKHLSMELCQKAEPKNLRCHNLHCLVDYNSCAIP